MVTTEQKFKVLMDLDQWFKVSGDVTVNQDLSVSVDGTVQPRDRGKLFPQGELPVQFAEVDNFYMDFCSLTSLKGCPHTVKSACWLNNNQIRSLQGAPKYVGKYLGIARNHLWNLEHLPLHMGSLALDYNKTMPLLRVLQANHVEWPSVEKQAPAAVKHIFDKYAGAGKKAMLNAALELKNAGYAENARW
jgi:hypothetical protein